MARNERDQEDLLSEATALVERVELRLADGEQSIVVGFRRDAAASFYFGADLVIQFNPRGELRRGFHEGKLLTVERGELVSLTRHREPREVQLSRHKLTARESTEFMSLARQRLSDLLNKIRGGDFQLVGQVPEELDVVGRVRGWLADLGPTLSLADHPHAAG